MTAFITSHPWLTVCSAQRAKELCAGSSIDVIGALLSIADIGSNKRPHGHAFANIPFAHKMEFEDTERDDEGCPTSDHVMQILTFGKNSAFHCMPPRYRAVVHCFAGRSRSTAAAFIILCSLREPGREAEAMTELLSACERSPLPNMLMCALADDILGRGGELKRVAQQQNDSPEDALCESGKPITTGTALLAAIKRGEL